MRDKLEEINKAARMRFDDMWNNKPLGPEKTKPALFEIYRAGFIGAFAWKMNYPVPDTKPKLSVVRGVEDDDGN